MDAQTKVAAQALAAGDPLGALNQIALRDDPPALALRGIAMARLGDFVRAKVLLKKAARTFGLREDVARARCTVALAEIALVSRDLGWSMKALAEARAVLERHGDRVNAGHACHLEVRRHVLLGRLDEAEDALAKLDPAPFPAVLRTAHELLVAGIAIRRLRTRKARGALDRAKDASCAAGIPALVAEVKNAALVLNKPAARLLLRGKEQLLLLEDVEALQESNTLVVDACRHLVRDPVSAIKLTMRPVLFALARALAEAWPADAARSILIARAFQAKIINESHRARLRVEIGRLRGKLRKLADIRATMCGFALTPLRGREVAVLAWPADEEYAAVLGLLADGERWSSSSLAVALGTSQRTVQRALDALATTGRVRALGRGRARRWVMPSVPEFTTILLLPAPPPAG